MKCEHCDRDFSTKSILIKHQRTAQYCLRIQNKKYTGGGTCEGCLKKFTRGDNLSRHRKTCILYIKETHHREMDEKEKETLHLKSIIKKQRKEIQRLREQLSKEEGKTEALKHKPGSKTVNNYINPKLLTITTDTIRPFTLETVREEIEGGGYTREMFNRGTLGIVEFVSNLISIENEDGEIERSYVCTDVSRNKFHRLLESNEWRSDNGAHFLTGVLDQLTPDVEEHYLDIVEKRRKAQADEDEVEYEYYNNRVNESRSLYQGVKFKKGEDREKLFLSLRNKISRIAAV